MDVKHRTKGFTLIELLVVVAIIAVLIAILLPALTQARRHAQTIQCLGQLRQIGQTWGMYWDENHDFIPPMQDWWNWGGTSGMAGQWWPLPNLLPADQRPMYYLDALHYAWISVKELFLCPSDLAANCLVGVPPAPLWWHVGTSYANNPHLCSHESVPRRVTGIPEPSRLIFLGDTTMFQANRQWYADVMWHDQPPGLRSNILFFDAHAALIAVESYPSPLADYEWFPTKAWY